MIDAPSPSALGVASVRSKKPQPPYSWQAKPALWRIREGFDATTYLDQGLAVYVVLCELASDEHNVTFDASRQKIAARSGVSVRRVSDIIARLKSLGLLDWKQNYIEGTKELAPNTYTLMSCTPCTTSGKASTGLGTDVNSGNCTVNKQSPKQSPKESGKKEYSENESSGKSETASSPSSFVPG